MSEDFPARLVLRRDALASGLTDGELSRLTRRREWDRLRRGAYVDGGLRGSDAERHLMLVQATLTGLRRPAVVSHQSAAVVHGLPLWGVALNRVHVTRRPPAWNDSSGILVAHVCRLGDDEVDVIGGLPVTTPLRTALDLARSLPFETAVVVLDAAVHAQMLERGPLDDALPSIAGTPGSRVGSRAVRFADGRSESVGESRSRVILHRLGLAPSTLQLRIRTPSGLVIGRSDFGWEAERVVGEFDGRIKYGRGLRPGQDAGDAVFAEKRREDAIRDEGWGVVRWTWADLQAPSHLGARVSRALARQAA